MGKIIFDLLLILADIWVIFDKETPKLLKCLALFAILILIICVTLQVLKMIGIL